MAVSPTQQNTASVGYRRAGYHPRYTRKRQQLFGTPGARGDLEGFPNPTPQHIAHHHNLPR